MLLFVARLRGATLPSTVAGWRPLIVLGPLNQAIYLGLTSVGLKDVSAGLGAARLTLRGRIVSARGVPLGGVGWSGGRSPTLD